MLNICYQMITLAAGSREHTQDAKAKLYGMIDLYRANQEPLSMTQTVSNVGCTRGDATTIGGSEQVLSPNVVRGKGRPPSLRRASRMEKDMRKVKAKEKKTQAKGKRKERDGGDAPILNTQRSLFGHSDMDIANAGHVQVVPESVTFHISGIQIQGTVNQSQESYEKGTRANSDMMEKLKDVILVSNVTQATQNAVGNMLSVKKK
ncbi:hypothetical protein Q3G72_031255 [Acer saccharum]|nr:hypothetical protein Q3G72_031255 [Acer saccharum]